MSNSFTISAYGGWRDYFYGNDIKKCYAQLMISTTINDYMFSVSDYFVKNVCDYKKDRALFKNPKEIYNLIKKTYDFIEKYKNDMDSCYVYDFLEFVLVSYIYFKNKDTKYKIGETFFYKVFDEYLTDKKMFDEYSVFALAVDNAELFKKIGYYTISNIAINIDSTKIHPKDTYYEELTILCNTFDKNIKEVVVKKLQNKYNKNFAEIIENNFDLFKKDELNLMLTGKNFKKDFEMDFDKEFQKIESFKKLHESLKK